MMEGFPLYEKPLVRARVRCGLQTARLACPQRECALRADACRVPPALGVCALQVGRRGQGGWLVPAAAGIRQNEAHGGGQRCGCLLQRFPGTSADARCACAVEANKKRRAKEAAAAAAPPSIASAAPPRIAPTPAPSPQPALGRPPYGMTVDGPPLPHKILFLQARALLRVRARRSA